MRPDLRARLSGSPTTDAPDGPRPLLAGWVGAKGLFAIALVFLLQAARPLLVPVAVALVLTFVLAGPVRALRRLGVPEAFGATLVVSALLAALLGLGATLRAPALQWLERAPQTLEQLLGRLDRVRASLPALHDKASPPARTGDPAATPPRDAGALEDKLASKGLDLTGSMLGHALSFSLQAAATVILLFCLLASEHWMVARTVQAIRRRRTRALVLSAVRAMQQEIGHFLGVLAIVNVGVAIALSLALQVVGLPDPVLWGVVAGVVNFIPYLGPVVITALLLLAGASHFADWLPMLAPAACFLAIHALEANVICPLAIGRRLALSPLSVFLSVMFWGWLWGVAGAMIAVPVLVGLRSVVRRNRRLRLLGLYLEAHRRETLPSLQALLHPAPERLTRVDEEPDRGDARQLPRQAERPISATTTSRKCGGEIGLTSTRK